MSTRGFSISSTYDPAPDGADPSRTPLTFADELGVPNPPHADHVPGAPQTTWLQWMAAIGHVATAGTLFAVAAASGHDPAALLPPPGTQPPHSPEELADIRAWAERRDVQALDVLLSEPTGDAQVAFYGRAIKWTPWWEPNPHPPEHARWQGTFTVRTMGGGADASCNVDVPTKSIELARASSTGAAADLASRGWMDVAALVDAP